MKLRLLLLLALLAATAALAVRLWYLEQRAAENAASFHAALDLLQQRREALLKVASQRQRRSFAEILLQLAVADCNLDPVSVAKLQRRPCRLVCENPAGAPREEFLPEEACAP